MGRVTFNLNGGLSSAQARTIHHAVLKILAETGVACDHQVSLDVMAAQEGVRFEDGRLKFAPELVDATIDRVRSSRDPRLPADRLCIHGSSNSLRVMDIDTDEVRTSLASDVVPMLKLSASLSDKGDAPVYPGDLDERIQVLWLEKACLEHTESFGAGMVTFDPAITRWTGKLYAAVGRKYTMVQCFMISPLRLDSAALDLLWELRDDPTIDVWPSLCSMPISGTTAPFFPSGLLAQGLSENLAALIVAQGLGLVSSKTHPVLRVDYGDPRYLTVAYSLPDNMMIQVLLNDLSEYFTGQRRDHIYLHTNSKLVNASAGADRMAHVLFLGLAGFRSFGGGQLSGDEVFSPVQFVIDVEIGRYVQRVLEGLSWEDDADCLAQIVGEGVAAGDFLTHPTTIDHLHKVFDSPLFQRDSVGQWMAAGKPRMEELARAKAKAAIAAYRFQRPPAQQAALNAVFADACRAVGVDLRSQPIPEG